MTPGGTGHGLARPYAAPIFSNINFARRGGTVSSEFHRGTMAHRLHREDIDEPELPPGSIRISDRRSLLPLLAALGSAGFDFRVEHRGRRRVILSVDPEEEEAVRRELDAVRRENRGWPPRGSLRGDRLEEDGVDRDPLFASALCVVALFALFAAWGPFNSDWPLLERAAMDAGAVRDGEWWRVFTAMTLHSGFPHLLGNALAALFFGAAAGRFCGTGMAWLLIILGGAAANTATAWTVAPPFRSIGASTATFAALGLVTVAQAIRNYRRYGRIRSFWHRSLVTLGAGIALLGFLGTSAGSDLRGHLYGFLFGTAFGGIAAGADTARLPARTQWALFSFAWVLMAVAWLAAATG